jgi:RNA polymerase sigma-70 factor (ECF subfamily)
MAEPTSAATAIDAVLAQHRQRLTRYVAHVVRDASEAEDLVQEILIRAHRGQGELREPGAGVAWLFRIATHVCVDHLRQRGRQPAVEAGVDPDGVDEAEADPVTLQATLERKEMSDCVRRYLLALPDDYRAVILLMEIEGLTGPEVSTLLGVPLTTVKMRLHRARRMLQEELEAGCSLSYDEHGVLVCEPKR